MDSKRNVTVSVQHHDPRGQAGALIKLQGEYWELNIYLTSAELSSLPAVRQATWSDRKTLQLGRTAGSHVFWAVDGDFLSVLVGHDDETWGFGVMVPIEILDEILGGT